MNEGVIETDGFSLRYCIEGHGIPTLVIGSSFFYPRVFSQNLRKHLRFIFVDTRGFVQPPDPVDHSAFTLDKLIDDVELVRTTLKLGRIIVVGHSGHGYIALEYAKKYPQNVSHIVLIALGPNHSKASHEAAEQYLQDSVCPERKAALKESLEELENEIKERPERRFIIYALRNGPRSWYHYAFDATSLWENVQVNMQMFDYVWGEVFRDLDISVGLDALNIPVLLALGRYDFLVAPASAWDPIRKHFHNLTVKVFEHSGHTPQYEEPNLFDHELLTWIKLNK